MKTVVRVIVQSHLSSNHQFVQRQVSRTVVDIPDTEIIDTAYLSVAVENAEGDLIELIQK